MIRRAHVIVVVSIVAGQIFFSNCGQVHNVNLTPPQKTDGSSNDTNSTPTPSPTPNPSPGATPTPVPTATPAMSLEQKAINILSVNCASCHGIGNSGGITMITDPAHLIAVGLVKPGDAVGSQLYDSISKGRMPPAGKLSDDDIKTIADWINAGAKAPTATPTPVPTPTPVALAATYKSIGANILVPKCVACHGPNLAEMGIRFDSYAETLKSVDPGMPNSSALYQSTRAGRMPKGGTPLGMLELRAISDWIKAGAFNN